MRLQGENLHDELSNSSMRHCSIRQASRFFFDRQINNLSAFEHCCDMPLLPPLEQAIKIKLQAGPLKNKSRVKQEMAISLPFLIHVSLETQQFWLFE
ncbi:hypothetical protein [Undibacterium sp. TS12]|uniref:hypothetical protein n=1 Tax=Undibacterium sp. TS12 TaxID=2908202 RepID=UPI001F4D11D0|nr:hypothetical protein [Undibacterium sp. TS12]MCH8619589.1 hypothetical protein [Undibacterium sp. TS12]